MPADELRARYLEILLARLADTSYPSASMLDRVEAAIRDRRTAERYIGSLLDHIAEDRFPSPPMIDRVERLLAVL